MSILASYFTYSDQETNHIFADTPFSVAELTTEAPSSLRLIARFILIIALTILAACGILPGKVARPQTINSLNVAMHSIVHKSIYLPLILDLLVNKWSLSCSCSCSCWSSFFCRLVINLSCKRQVPRISLVVPYHDLVIGHPYLLETQIEPSSIFIIALNLIPAFAGRQRLRSYHISARRSISSNVA